MTGEDGLLNVIQAFIENPNESVRYTVEYHGVSHETVPNILKKSGLNHKSTAETRSEQRRF